MKQNLVEHEIRLLIRKYTNNGFLSLKRGKEKLSTKHCEPNKNTVDKAKN